MKIRTCNGRETRWPGVSWDLGRIINYTHWDNMVDRIWDEEWMTDAIISDLEDGRVVIDFQEMWEGLDVSTQQLLVWDVWMNSVDTYNEEQSMYTIDRLMETMIYEELIPQAKGLCGL